MAFRSLLAALLGFSALVPDARAKAPAFHLVLSDGNSQLKGQADRICDAVTRSFRTLGVEVTWSFDPSDPALPSSNVVKVIVLPHAGDGWGMSSGVMAAVRRDGGSKGMVFVFYKEIERILNLEDSRATRSLQGWRAPGRRIISGLANVLVHEILHYFLPGRPHDMEGVFMSHIGGNLLVRSSLEISSETREALVRKLLRDAPSAAAPRDPEDDHRVPLLRPGEELQSLADGHRGHGRELVRGVT